MFDLNLESASMSNTEARYEQRLLQSCSVHRFQYLMCTETANNARECKGATSKTQFLLLQL